MRKLLICALTLGMIVSCEVEEPIAIDDPSGQDNKEKFEIYKSFDLAMGGLDKISEQAFQDAQTPAKIIESSCLSLEFRIPYQENPVIGFSNYTYYNKLVLDATEAHCKFDDWTGKVEYYVAGVLQSKWKDSTIFKNVRGDDGYSFDGYRVATKNEILSTGSTQVFDVVIDGKITNPEGNAFTYRTDRNFSFEDRFTSEEEITLTESSSLEGIDQTFSMSAKSIEGKPLVYKVACFSRADFLEYPVAGSLDFSTSFSTDFNIDFGDGACDKEVTLSSEEGSITFEL